MKKAKFRGEFTRSGRKAYERPGVRKAETTSRWNREADTLLVQKVGELLSQGKPTPMETKVYLSGKLSKSIAAIERRLACSEIAGVSLKCLRWWIIFIRGAEKKG